MEIVMNDTDQKQHITIDHQGRQVASADLESCTDTDTISASMHVESGHVPAGTRSQLVDAVVDRAWALQADRLEVCLPAGDGEMLDRLRERCPNVDTRAAGASCLADAQLQQQE
jgi:hypothetical protein